MLNAFLIDKKHVFLKIALLSFIALLHMGCGEDEGLPSCLFYNIDEPSKSDIYSVNRNNASNQIDYCNHGKYDANGILVKDKRVIRDGLCQRILDATQEVDLTSVYGGRGHSLRIHDGDRYLIKGSVDPDKIKPILDVLYAECPSFEERPNTCE